MMTPDTDGCDILLDVVQSVVTTGICDVGFTLDVLGVIIHTGTAEVLKDVDGEGDDAADLDNQTMVVTELGCKCCAKIHPKQYKADWESH